MKLIRDLENKRVIIHPDGGKKIEVRLGKFGDIIQGLWTCKPCPAFVKLWGNPRTANAELRELGFKFISIAGAWIIFFNPTWLVVREVTDETREFMRKHLDYNDMSSAGEEGRFWFISGYLRGKYPDRTYGELSGIISVVHAYIEQDIPAMLEEIMERATN